MSASASSLFTNFHPFFVSRYEGREELCREIQARRHHCKPSQWFRNAILLVEDGVELEAGDVITE